MLAIISAIFGFVGPFIPEGIKLASRWLDHKQEIQLMQIRAQIAEKEHLWRLEEINSKADIEEMKTLRQPMESYGVQLLDAASEKLPVWVTTPVFWAYGVLDFLRGMVRPVITFSMFGFYAAYKWAQLETMRAVSDASFSWYEGVLRLWGEEDMAVFVLVMSYWFGNRIAKKAFGWDK